MKSLQVDVTSIFFPFCYIEVCKSVEERVRKTLLRKNTKPLLPGSPCHCFCHGVAPHSVAAAFDTVLLPSAPHAGAVRSNSNTPPLFVLHTKQKSTKSRTIPLNPHHLIKTSAVKTLWEKHLLVRKRVLTHACRQDARTCFNKRNLHHAGAVRSNSNRL